MRDDRACLFDMDGLLLDTETVGQQAFVQVMGPLGIDPAKARTIFLELVGSSSIHARAHLEVTLPKDVDHAALDAAWLAAFQGLLEREVPVKAGVADTLAALSSKGRVMAVVTSTRTHHARDHLERAGLLGHFVTVIGGDAVSANKPDPAPYLAGAAAVARHPGDCVAFEDSDRGTTAAIRAGCEVWQIPDLRPKNVPLPILGQNHATSLREAVETAKLL